jgi:PEGA domain
MQSAATSSAPGSPADFSDGLGIRLKIADPSVSEPLEVLRLRDDFLAAASFEFMLRERVSRLANFRHAYYSRVRRVDRLDNGSALGLISEAAQGARLSHILEVAHTCHLDLDVNAALCLVRQLVPAVAMLHQNARDVAHGTLAPERIVVTSNARVVIVEYVLGAAVEQLGYSRERLWKELRIAVPSGAGVPRLNHRTDVMQIGMIALALVLGRPLRDDDLKSLAALVASATENSVLGGREPISEPLRRWLSRSLQLDARSSFESALEAQLALDDVLSGEAGYIAAPIALETFLARYEECALTLPPASPAPVAPPPEPPRPAPAVVAAPAPKPTPVVAVPPPAPPPVTAAVAIAPAPVTEAPKVKSTPAPPAILETREIDARPPEREIEVAAFAEPFVSSPAVAPAPKSTPTMPLQAEAAPSDIAADDEQLRQIFASAASPVATATGVPAFWRTAALVAAVLALLEGGFIVWKVAGAAIPARAGTMKLESKPSGAQVKIDGQSRGATPLTLSLSAGTHVVELSAGGEPRVIPVTLPAGETLSQYVELAGGSALGRLAVTSTPPGANLLLDGKPVGTAPAEIADIAPGEHELVAELGGARVRQVAAVTGGATTSVTVALDGTANAAGAATPPATPSNVGGVAVKVPFEMQVFEGDRLIGNTTKKLALPAGPHELQIVSDTLAFRTTVRVEIVAGKMTYVPVTLPKGVIHLNATPWAEVWIDGENVGETPLGNLPITIGPHEIVFKNPQYGEQHHAATVTAAAPVRLSVDLTKPQ